VGNYIFRFIIGWVFWHLGVVVTVPKSTLEICFFDTGQGNLIAIRANDVNSKTQEATPKLIFIDCGSTLHKEKAYEEKLKDEKDARNQKLVELFKNISEYGILVTHNHADHDNLIDAAKSVSSEGREKSVMRTIIRPMSRKVFVDDSRKNKIDDALRKDWERFCNEELPYIENSLGPRVRIVPMRPERWQDNGAQNPEHDFNVMYLVEFAGRRILFTGDASPQLFTQITNNPKYAREIKGVDFLVLPHHGSNRAGELMTFPSIVPEMCIVCSNPNEQDHLPWEEVGSLPFKVRPNDVFSRKHVMSMGNRKENKKRKSIVAYKKSALTCKRSIFITCDAAQGYYELVIDANGTATLFDGPIAKRLDMPLFRSL
jgi:beta-lactamase superfamily II metal-dependent hydrolase